MTPNPDAHSPAAAAGKADRSDAGPRQAGRGPQRRLRLAVFLLLVVLAALIIPFPLEGRLWGEIFDLAHGPVFFSTLLLMVALIDPGAVGWPGGGRPWMRLNFRRLLVLTILLMALGMAGEFLQQFAGRHSNWSDVIANCAGLLAGLCWIVAVAENSWKRVVLRVVAVGLLLLVTLPSAVDAWACLRQMNQFPLLAGFEDARELKSWTAQNAKLDIDSSWSSQGANSLSVQLQPGRYSGTAMIWFEANWQAHQHLTFHLRNPNSFALDVVLKVFDGRHTSAGFQPDDRFHRRIRLAPRADRVVFVSLADVASGPATRSLDLHDVRGLEFFCMDLARPAELQLDEIRLTD